MRAMRGKCCGRLLLGTLGFVCLAAGGWAQQTDAEKYELRGKVINAVTGAGVGNALVQLSLAMQQVQFSGPDGAFVFTEVPRGTYQVTATKPGYFNEQEMGASFGGVDSLKTVPAEGDAVVKLTPEGIIYGRVENESGQPIDGMTVRAETWQVINGVKRLQTIAAATTDDEGQFRIAELKPGSYYVNFVHAAQGLRIYDGLARKNPNEQGYGSQFYPGVPDAGSATAIRVRGGAPVQINQSLKPQRLYGVSGVVHGVNVEKGFQVMLTDSAGEMVAKKVNLDQKTGGFQIEGVPEGRYLLAAMAEDPSGGQRGEHASLTAMLPIHLNRDMSGLALMLGRGANIEVNIDDEIPAQQGEFHQVLINLASTEFQQMSRGLTLPPPPGVPQVPRLFEDIAPGTYEVEATANGRGYVASLQCGDVDLLRDDLTVTVGAAVPPIEVRLREGGAEIEVEVTENGKPAAAIVLLYSEEYPRRSMVLPVAGELEMNNLRPGRYKVAAFKGIQQVEFREAAFVEKYLAQGKEVSLKVGEKVSVAVEVQDRVEE